MQLPKIYNIDIANRCNLKCVWCLEGIGYNEQPKEIMSLEDFKRISSSFLKYAEEINLHNWSEPFLNKDIFDIVKFINDNSKANVIISTNGNVFRGEMAKRLLNLKIYRFMLTISGLENRIYRLYHRLGDIERVFKTVKLITDERLKRGRDDIREFQIKYLLFDYNYVSRDAIRKCLSRKIGIENLKKIDKIDRPTGYLMGTTLSPEEMKRSYKEDFSRFIRKRPFKGNCKQQPDATAIRCDGKVFFCCAMPYRDEHVMGDLNASDMHEIWNSPRYKKMREDYLSGINDICDNCFIYNVGIRYLKKRHILEKLQNRAKKAFSTLK